MRNIVVVEYDPTWPTTFNSLRARVWPAVRDIAVSIEHMGSTSVPGLAAKPVIDMSVALASADRVSEGIERLETLGYVHRGDLGIEGREAFRSPAELPAHHLYMCPAGSLGLLNPLALRDYLRAHPDAAQAYGALKKSLAAEFPHDIDRYVGGKTDFVVGILREVGFTTEQLEAIERMNPRLPEAGVS
jgi:GrpB-like predicted nucleotidyltransferase (UPF0157 family)